MSGVLNDCDALLQGASVRILNGKGATILLTLGATGFHLNSDGVADIPTVSVKADLVGLDGTVSFSANGGTLSNATARSVDVNYTGSAATVTASVVSGGETITRAIVVPVLRDGAAGSGTPGENGTNGADGISPDKNSIAFLYKWTTTAPAKPAGTSTFTWAGGANSAYGGADGWSISVPTNPGTPLIQLFVASVAVTAAATATTTTVSYASSTVAAWAQNGSNGSNGATGVQSGEASVYQWAATIPAGPTGSPTFTWASSSFGAAPTNWTLTPGPAPSPGMTLWRARVNITDSAAAATTAFNWTSASILAMGYAGTNGTSGDPGAEGVSYVTAYCASATASTNTAPAATLGRNSLPADNSGGITGTWSKPVPALTSGQFMYQSDGLYNPATDTVTWSVPYWSSLKVGSLSAITANLGAITAGSIDLGSGSTSWHVDTAGNQWAGAASFNTAPLQVTNTGAITAASATLRGSLAGGAFTSYEWPSSGVGFYIGAEGFKCGTVASGKYFNADQFGDVYAPNFTILNGVPTFSNGSISNTNITGANLNAFTVSNNGSINSQSGPANAERNVGTRTVTVSGNYKDPLSYAWSVAGTESANGYVFSVRIQPSGASCTVHVKGGDDIVYATIACTVTDGNGITRVSSFGVTATFGTGAA